MIKLFKTLFLVLLIISLLWLFSRLENIYNSSVVKDIDVFSKNCYSYNFINDIMNDIKYDTVDFKGMDLGDLEFRLAENLYVEEANLYFTIDRKLNIYVKERLPIVKINDNKGNAFFLDANFCKIPDTRKYDVNHLVANGFINDDNLFLIHQISKEIFFNKFWKNFISQIYVTENNIIELIPVLFDHKIIINNVVQLDKAELFYKTLTNTSILSKYHEINFIYDNQIVGVK